MKKNLIPLISIYAGVTLMGCTKVTNDPLFMEFRTTFFALSQRIDSWGQPAVAKVDGEAITKKDLKEVLADLNPSSSVVKAPNEHKQTIVDMAIQRKIIFIKEREAHIDCDDPCQLRLAQLRDSYRYRVYQSKVTSQEEFTEEEIQKYYKTHWQEFQSVRNPSNLTSGKQDAFNPNKLSRLFLVAYSSLMKGKISEIIITKSGFKTVASKGELAPKQQLLTETMKQEIKEAMLNERFEQSLTSARRSMQVVVDEKVLAHIDLSSLNP